MFGLVVLVFYLLTIKNVSAECFDNPTGMSPVCIPGHWNIVKLNTAKITATSTCGTPREEYCRLKPMNGCFNCSSSSSDERKRHPAEYIVDKFISPITWWQSETWWKWHQTHPSKSLEVNITLNFNKSFDMTGLLTLTFESPRPHKMVLEKSSDWGRTWMDLQYYASNCETQFLMSNSDPTTMRLNDSRAFCTEKYSSNSPQRGGKLLFDFKTRYDEEGDFFYPFIQKYLHTTDLRFRLEYPGTNGLEGVTSEENLKQFFYAISDLSIIGRCKCYGHAQFCHYPESNQSVNQTRCECLHYTGGNDCERCLPLYNNRTWQPATSKYQPNPCEKCECNNHSDACLFNEDLRFGVCQDCKHNTAGYLCDKCQEKFYRNMNLSVKHPLVCPACYCDKRGIVNNGSCHTTNGQCDCRHNITGRQCDRCVDTYYGYTVDPIGHCKACLCVETGTKNGSLNCEQVTGQCRCKETINQLNCSMCKDGYYEFPTAINKDCLRCNCDYGGSISELCNKINGTCQCRKDIQGTRCTKVRPGYYVGSLTHFKMEAEEAEGTYQYTGNTEDLDKYFTGTGYSKITGGQYVDFHFKSNATFRSYLLLRYTALSDSIDDLQMKVLGKRTDGCPAVNYTYLISGLQKGNGSAWKSRGLIQVCDGQEYSFNVSFVTSPTMASSIKLDSLILLPEINNTKIYDIAIKETHAHTISASTIVSCWQNATTLVKTSLSLPVCHKVTFSVMAEVQDGALPCLCNSTGSIPYTPCNQQGGQCQCRPGVTGRSCDRCKPGFYNFTSAGCTACNCSQLGSQHLVCDAVTGLCPCKPGVVTRTCDRCNHTYYGFNTSNGCVECKCNASGSAEMQCNDTTGECPCKDSTDGHKCDECKDGFYNYTTTGCHACNCDVAGSNNTTCDLQTGKCTCKKNVLGFKCDECKPSTFNRDANNPYGCTPCFCFGRSGNCSSAQGFKKTNIESFPTSSEGSEGWSLVHTNITGFHQEGRKLLVGFSPSAQLSLSLPPTLRRFHLRSYGELMSFQMKYTSASSIEANWTLDIRNRRKTVRFPLSPPPSVDETTYYVRLHEANAITTISARQLQEVLADIIKITIRGKFNSSGTLTISGSSLQTAIRGMTKVPAGNVENCSCTNERFTGLSCQLCGEGYTRNETIYTNTSRYSEDCKLCDCSYRSKKCDAEDGTCRDCRIGTEGVHCELCEPNVDNLTDCTRCLTEYYGLYQPVNSRGCRACDCLVPNTRYSNQTVCKTGLNSTTDTGQCTCKGTITGRMCDRCHENAYNGTNGTCVDCPECYGLLQVFIHQLRENITRLNKSMINVKNGQILDKTFAKKLGTSIQNVRELVLRAQNSTGVEKELHDELQALNQTLDHMEGVLATEVTPGVMSVEGVVRDTSDERNLTEDLINMTRTMVYQANSILNSSILLMVSQANTTEGYLSGLDPMFGAYANEASTISANQNQTGQYILKKTQTAEGLVRDANSTSLVTVSDHRRNSELIRRLRLDTETVRDLGVKANRSAYAVFANATMVLSNAQLVLLSVNQLNPNNSLEVEQILNNASRLADNATRAVQTVQYLNQEHSTLISNIVQAVQDAKMLISRVTTADEGATAMRAEARRAEAEAQAAVDSAKTTHEDTKEMLRILKEDFAQKAINSQRLAQEALEKSKEANETSINAIAYSQNIDASIQAALRIATDGLNMAKRAQRLATEENMNVSAVHSQAVALKGNADASTHTPEQLAAKLTNTTNITTSIQQPINSCNVNYSVSANFAKEKSEEANYTAMQASRDINSAKDAVDQIVSQIPHLQQVNATRLSELKENIDRLREQFSTKNVKGLNVKILNAQLKVEKDKQQVFIDDYKRQMEELRTQVEEMKVLRGSLSSVAYRGCT